MKRARSPLGMVARCSLLLWVLTVLAFVAAKVEIPDGKSVVFALLQALGELCFWSMFTPLIYNQLRGRSDREDRALLAGQLADILEQDVPVPEALEALLSDRASRLGDRFSRMRFALASVLEGVRRGDGLAAAVEATDAFPEVWSRLLERAEATERLPLALNQLASLEFESPRLPLTTWWRILLVLPLLLAVVFFLDRYILPAFVQLDSGFRVPLPWGLRIMLQVSHGPLSCFFLPLQFLLLIIALGCVFPRSRRRLGRLAARIPWPGWKQAQQSRAALTMAAAASLELPVPETLALAATSADNPFYQRALGRLSEDCGGKLGELLGKRPDLFGPELRWLVTQGERYGRLDQALTAAAEHLSRLQQARGRRAMQLFDTTVLAVLGGLVLLVTSSVMLTFQQLVSSMGFGGLR